MCCVDLFVECLFEVCGVVWCFLGGGIYFEELILVVGWVVVCFEDGVYFILWCIGDCDGVKFGYVDRLVLRFYVFGLLV